MQRLKACCEGANMKEPKVNREVVIRGDNPANVASLAAILLNPAINYYFAKLHGGAIVRNLSDAEQWNAYQWWIERHRAIADLRAQLAPLKDRLAERGLWSAQDQSRYDLTQFGFNDFHCAVESQLVPHFRNWHGICGNDALIETLRYTFRSAEAVDASYELLIEEANLRLALAKDDYADGPSRRADLRRLAQYSELMDQVGLRADAQPVSRFLIENVVRDVLGEKTLVNFSALPYGLSRQQAIKRVLVCEVGTGAPPSSWRVLSGRELKRVEKELATYDATSPADPAGS
jgi:hypothetical protein